MSVFFQVDPQASCRVKSTRFKTAGLLIAAIVVLGCGQSAERTGIVSSYDEAPATYILPASRLDATALDSDATQGDSLDQDQHDFISENPFRKAIDSPLSTFSIDVDTASYSKVRQHLIGYGRLPRPGAVRIEELLNYFSYDYTPPQDDQVEPFAAHIAVTQAPWQPKHRLARIALKARVIENQRRPASNLVFLVDTSGSMNQPNKLPLLKRSLSLLLRQLNENDRVAMVAYAGQAGVLLPSTPVTPAAIASGSIVRPLSQLCASGSTYGSAGLALAYQIAKENFISDGTNRVILCTDGDFNVGQTSNDQLISMVQSNAKTRIDLTVLGFGMGNLNDAMLEQISGKGNGNYAFIDSFNEANKVLKQQLAGTLVTIAKDVKLQVEFNPAKVAAYRLIGYENRMLAQEDFNDDKKDAGEIGAGHTVTALYEIIPTGTTFQADLAPIDPLKYQQPPKQSTAAQSDELLTLKLRYKLPQSDTSELMEVVATDTGGAFSQSDTEFQFAAAVAGFGMLLRDSPHKGGWSYDSVNEIAQSAVGHDPYGLRKEFLELVTTAGMLAAH